MKTRESLNPFGTKIKASSLQQIAFTDIEALLSEFSLVLVRGLETPTRDRFLEFCEAAPGYKTLDWSFGPVMEMRELTDSPNYLFTREAVPFHWDGAFHQVPDYLVFSCVKSPTPGTGGETLFTNTERIVKEASASDLYAWSQIRLKYKTEKLAHYGGSIEGPLLQTHPHSKTPILRFAEEVRTELNPVTLEVKGLGGGAREDFLADLTTRIYDRRFCYRHTWEPGDLLFVDNHAVIHGRSAVFEDEPRHLRRIQLMKRLEQNGSTHA
jgi:alpha-ketoglutarate-dependent taurine dioxygenase